MSRRPPPLARSGSISRNVRPPPLEPSTAHATGGVLDEPRYSSEDELSVGSDIFERAVRDAETRAEIDDGRGQPRVVSSFTRSHSINRYARPTSLDASADLSGADPLPVKKNVDELSDVGSDIFIGQDASTDAIFRENDEEYADESAPRRPRLMRAGSSLDRPSKPRTHLSVRGVGADPMPGALSPSERTSSPRTYDDTFVDRSVVVDEKPKSVRVARIAVSPNKKRVGTVPPTSSASEGDECSSLRRQISVLNRMNRRLKDEVFEGESTIKRLENENLKLRKENASHSTERRNDIRTNQDKVENVELRRRLHAYERRIRELEMTTPLPPPPRSIHTARVDDESDDDQEEHEVVRRLIELQATLRRLLSQIEG